MANGLALYSGTDLSRAYETPLSEAEQFFASEALIQHKKAREAEFKLQMHVISRLDAVNKNLAVLGGRR